VKEEGFIFFCYHSCKQQKQADEAEKNPENE